MASSSNLTGLSHLASVLLCIAHAAVAIESGSYDVTGYDCTGTRTHIWCPSSPGQRPVVLFAHGKGGWRESYGSILRTFATQGLIVIAPGTEAGICKSADDLAVALRASQSNPSLHACLKNADFTQVGVAGHSMGAKHLAQMIKAHHSSAHITAAVFMHGAEHTDGLTVPSMFMTTADDTVASRDVPWAFDQCSAENKVLADQATGGHAEPEDYGRLNLYAARFLSCHLRRARTHCQVIYSTGEGTICQASGVEYEDCEVKGRSPSRRLRVV